MRTCDRLRALCKSQDCYIEIFAGITSVVCVTTLYSLGIQRNVKFLKFSTEQLNWYDGEMEDEQRIISTILTHEELIRYGLIDRRPEWANDIKLEGYIRNSSSYPLRTVNETPLLKLIAQLTAEKHSKAIIELEYVSGPSRTVIRLGDRVVNVRSSTPREHPICEIILRRNSHKTWQWDELAEKLHIIEPTEKDKQRIYKTNYDLRVKLNRLAPDILIVTDKTVTLNPIFKVRRSA
jgi:hypothetical protein